MNRITNFLIVIGIFTILGIDSIYSQGMFEFHAGLSNPMSDFGSDSDYNDEAGGALTGINVGLKYTYLLNDKGVGLYAGLDFNYNGLSQKMKKEVKEVFGGIYNATYDYFEYYNFPISGGLYYIYEANNNVSIFGNGGLTLNFLKVSDLGITAYGETLKFKFDIANSLGYRLGGGILFNKRVSIAVDYWGLGKHDMSAEVSLAGDHEDFDGGEITVDILPLTLGYNF